MSFKTEFEFTLPKGFVDKEGRVHKKGLMRLATAKDEIAPLQDYRVQQNKAYLVVILLSRVITSLGDLKSINPSVIEDLYASDLAYLQELYKRVNENGSTIASIKCPACAQSIEYDICGDCQPGE
jgi:hypothetical protein